MLCHPLLPSAICDEKSAIIQAVFLLYIRRCFSQLSRSFVFRVCLLLFKFFIIFSSIKLHFSKYKKNTVFSFVKFNLVWGFFRLILFVIYLLVMIYLIYRFMFFLPDLESFQSLFIQVIFQPFSLSPLLLGFRQHKVRFLLWVHKLPKLCSFPHSTPFCFLCIVQIGQLLLLYIPIHRFFFPPTPPFHC